MTVTGGDVTRQFALGEGVSFGVRCASRTIKTAVEQTFADLTAAATSTSLVEFEVTEHDDGRLTVRAPDREVGPQSRNGALVTLVTSVTRFALDSDPSRLHLHCAAVGRSGRGVLISASSGVGKTSLTAALLLAGWTYISDESVAVGFDSLLALGFPKPLLIKILGEALHPELMSKRVSLDDEDEFWWLVPASAVPAAYETRSSQRSSSSSSVRGMAAPTSQPSPLGCILRTRSSRWMGQTMDAGRFGERAVLLLASIAARSTCVRLTVGPLEAAVAALGDLVNEHRDLVRVRDVPPPASSVHGWLVVPSVRSVLIGDRVVVHNTETGSIAALDEAGTAVWIALHGEAPAWWEPAQMRAPSTMQFLEQLESIGFVERGGRAREK